MTTTTYKTITIQTLVARRTGWLSLFLAGLLLCATIMHNFERLLKEELELAIFVPLLIGHAGNSGGQTVSTVIRELGCGTITIADTATITMKEAATGIIQSIVLIGLLLPYFMLMNTSSRVSLVVSITMVILGCFANMCGAILPFAFTRIGMDPAVIVSPLMTTAIDTLGVLIYLSIAAALMTHPIV